MTDTMEKTLQRIALAEVKGTTKITILGNIRRNMIIHITENEQKTHILTTVNIRSNP